MVSLSDAPNQELRRKIYHHAVHAWSTSLTPPALRRSGQCCQRGSYYVEAIKENPAVCLHVWEATAEIIVTLEPLQRRKVEGIEESDAVCVKISPCCDDAETPAESMMLPYKTGTVAQRDHQAEKT